MVKADVYLDRGSRARDQEGDRADAPRFDAFLDHIAEREPDLEPEVMDWLVKQWTAVDEGPVSFKTRDGQLVVVATQDIPNRSHITCLQDIVLFVGDEAAIDAEVLPPFAEWIKGQSYAWCGPFRLARRGCSSCSNTKWDRLKPIKGFPQHTARQVLKATKPIKKGDVISCNFGNEETKNWFVKYSWLPN